MAEPRYTVMVQGTRAYILDEEQSGRPIAWFTAQPGKPEGSKMFATFCCKAINDWYEAHKRKQEAANG